jgi:hypothetical protein
MGGATQTDLNFGVVLDSVEPVNPPTFKGERDMVKGLPFF